MFTCNVTSACARLSSLVAGLRAAASGAVVDRAAAKVQAQIDAVSRAKVTSHELSGHAASVLEVSRLGGLVQVKASAYLHFHRWWPFRSGMPPFVVKRAALIFAAELVAALGGRGKPGGSIADDVLAEGEASAAKGAARKAKTTARKNAIKRLKAATS